MNNPMEVFSVLFFFICSHLRGAAEDDVPYTWLVFECCVVWAGYAYEHFTHCRLITYRQRFARAAPAPRAKRFKAIQSDSKRFKAIQSDSKRFKESWTCVARQFTQRSGVDMSAIIISTMMTTEFNSIFNSIQKTLSTQEQ